MHYYGVRGARTSPEEDLWIRYFTSSKYVKKYRQEFGEPDLIEVRQVFEDVNRYKAIEWERRVLIRLKVVKSPTWLNRYDGSFHGAPGPKNHGWKISQTTKGRKKPVDIVERINKNPEKIRKTALAHRGMKRSEESKQIMSSVRKAFLNALGGAQNKGKKLYYNPEDSTQRIQCFPSFAPPGWLNGNPKRKGTKPYINAAREIRWWDPVVVDLSEWQPWNPKIAYMHTQLSNEDNS